MKKTCLSILLALPLLIAALPTRADDKTPFKPMTQTSMIAVTTAASTPEQLTPLNACLQYQVANVGSADAWVQFAATSVLAVPDIPAAGNPGTSLLSKAGTTFVVTQPQQSYISAKTASGTTTLVVSCGLGAVSGVDSGASTAAGTNNIGDVDVEIIGRAATVDAESTAVVADTTLEAATASLRLMGWTIRESAGTAAVATVVLRHDTVATTCDGPPFAYIELDANQSATMEYADRGKAAASGICLDWIAGTVDVNVSYVVEAAP